MTTYFAHELIISIYPEGRFGTDRPIGETDTYRDTMYSEVRSSKGARLITSMNWIFLHVFIAFFLFIPVKRAFDFWSVSVEQKKK